MSFFSSAAAASSSPAFLLLAALRALPLAFFFDGMLRWRSERKLTSVVCNVLENNITDYLRLQ